MDPKRDAGYSLVAPGAPALTSLRFPGTPRPRLDEHIAPVEDEERIEILDGQPLSAMAGSTPAHSGPQATLAALLHSLAAPGYTAHVELLTRHEVEQDLVTDACILREGTDPSTGDRYLEELGFEVANEQTLSSLRKKAQRLRERGVRRVFGVLVKRGCVLELSTGQEVVLHLDEVIADPCLRLPLRVRALVDALEADNAIAHGLEARGTPAIVEMKARAEVRGEVRGEARALLLLLEARGFAVPDDVRLRILSADTSALDAWITRAATAASLEAVFG